MDKQAFTEFGPKQNIEKTTTNLYIASSIIFLQQKRSFLEFLPEYLQTVVIYSTLNKPLRAKNPVLANQISSIITLIPSP